MNLGASTSKLNVNSGGGNSGVGGGDNKQQYIPSRIFSQDKIEEKNNIHLSSPPHSTTTPSSLQSQSGSLQTPNTPYSTYFRASGPYQSSPHEMNNNTPNLNRRFGYSTQNLNNSVNGGVGGTNTNSDLFSIPVNSIYEEPKQLKQHILQQHQNQQFQSQMQKNAAVQLQRNNLNTLTNYLKADEQQQLQLQLQLQQQQQQQQQTPPGTSQPLMAQDLNQTNYQQQQFYNQQPQQQQQQFYNQQQSQYNPQQQLIPQTPQQQQQQQQNVYNTNTNSPFTNIYNQQQQLQLQQQQQQQINPNLGISTYGVGGGGGVGINSNNVYVQSVPSQQITQVFSEKYDKRWLTVFGFSQDKTDLIIDELSKYANIIEIAYPQQPNSNWVYLKFDSEATSADILKKNGLVLGNCMIGIVPYKEIIKKESDPMKPQSLYDNSYNTIEKKYQPARSDYDPQSFSNIALNTPTRPSFFSKVSEYVFGSN